MLWRKMLWSDLPGVMNVAAIVHPDYPEDESVFVERLTLYPEGCRVLKSDDGRCYGYILSHPWIFGHPPTLNSHLEQLPDSATSYYLHDLALLPEARKYGAAGEIVRLMIDHATNVGYGTMTLVAVNRSVPFWESRGFNIVENETINLKLASYGEDASFMAYILG